jgi:hypothetical protein
LKALPDIYFCVISHLVSHGFIVIAPEHADGSASVSHTIMDGKQRLLEHSQLSIPESVSSDVEFIKRNKQLHRRILGMLTIINANMPCHNLSALM